MPGIMLGMGEMDSKSNTIPAFPEHGGWGGGRGKDQNKYQSGSHTNEHLTAKAPKDPEGKELSSRRAPDKDT